MVLFGCWCGDERRSEVGDEGLRLALYRHGRHVLNDLTVLGHKHHLSVEELRVNYHDATARMAVSIADDLMS